MNSLLWLITDVLSGNSLIVAFVVIGLVMWVADLIAKKVVRGRIHSSAIAILLGLMIAGVGGVITGGNKGISDLGIFAGMGVFGGSVIRDFIIISTAYGAEWSEIKKCGIFGFVSIFIGIALSYTTGVVVAYAFGYRDLTSVATIAAGSVTFVVGPVTGAAIGADSAVIAISVVAGLVKSIAVMLLTPFVAKPIGLTTPRAAMIYGGLIGSVSGTTAGLTAANPKLVPYCAMTASFYTGMGCLLCPSVLYGLTKLVLPL